MLDVFALAAKGQGQLVILTGSVSSGKTAFLQTVIAMATAEGALVLSATGSRVERSMPLGIIRQLIRSAELPDGLLDRLDRLLDDGAFTTMLAEPDSELSQRVPPSIIQELCDAVLGLAQHRPLLLTVDDLRYADEASVECLSYIGRRLAPSRCLMVLSQPHTPVPGRVDFHAELLRQPHCRHVWLRPLSEAGVRAMVSAQLGAAAAVQFAAECHQLSGGNPLLMQGLIEDLRAAPRPLSQISTGAGFGRALLSCLHRCDFDSVRLARGLAVLGEHATPALLGKLLDVPAEAAAGSLRALDNAGIVDGLRLRHPGAASVIHEGMTPDDLANAHHRAAELLRDDGAPATAVARHMLAAERVERPWGLATLREAAEIVLGEGDTELALRYLRLAHHTSRDPQERAAVTAALARAEWRIDPLLAKRHIDEQAAALKAGHLSGPDTLTQVTSLLWLGRVDETVQTVEQLSQLPEKRAAENAEWVETSRMLLSCVDPSIDVQQRLPPIRMADAAPPTPDPRRRTMGLLARAMRGRSQMAYASVAEQALQCVGLDDHTLWFVVAAILVLINEAHPAVAARWCDRLLDEAQTRRAPTWEAIFSGLRAEIFLRTGDLHSATRHARIALTRISPRSWGIGLAAPVATLVDANTAMGNYEEAAGYLRTAMPDTTFQTPLGLHYLHARGCFYQANRHYLAALADFQACGTAMARWRTEFPAIVPWRVGAAHACVGLGRRQEARELISEQLGRLGSTNPRIRGMSLRVLAASGDAKKRPALLNQAIDALRASGDRLELARAMADLGEAYAARGEVSRARLLIEDANRTARQCGAPLVPMPDQRGHRADPPQHLGALTDSERRVAVMAAHGQTNRQIATELHITMSTVEQHLTRVYNKLSVKRRTDLAHKLPVDQLRR